MLVFLSSSATSSPTSSEDGGLQDRLVGEMDDLARKTGLSRWHVVAGVIGKTFFASRKEGASFHRGLR